MVKMQAAVVVEEKELQEGAGSQEQLVSPTLEQASSAATQDDHEAAPVSPSPVLPMDISVVGWPTPKTSANEAKSYRYPNPGGNFYTGMDITSEVGGASGWSLYTHSVPTGCC